MTKNKFLQYRREVLILLGVIPTNNLINNQITLVFTTPLSYQEFVSNAAIALDNHPANGHARRYLECVIEAHYMAQFQTAIDTRNFLFTFTNIFTSNLSRGKTPTQRRRTDGAISQPIVVRKANSCEIAEFETDIRDDDGGSKSRCRTCGGHEGGECYLSEEMTAQKIGAEAHRRNGLGQEYFTAVEDARGMVYELVRERLVKPASRNSNWMVLFFAFAGGVAADVLFHIFTI